MQVEIVRDRASAKAWVASLPAADSSNLLAHIDKLLAHLDGATLAPEVLLEILERVRTPFSNAVRIRMPDCENRALPLSPREAALFLELISTTHHLCNLYIRVVDATGGAYIENLAAPLDRTPEGQRALDAASPLVFALQQALDLLASIASAHYRARIAVPDAIWEETGRLARIAQQADCLDIVPKQARSDSSASDDTCRSAFGYAILMRLCNPYRLTLLEMSVARYCSIRWGHKLGFRISGADTPLTVPANASLMLGQHAVRLDTVRVCSSIRMRMESLRTGKSPDQLGFSSKLSSESCYALLERIHALWHHGQDSDVIWRRPLVARARIAIGLPRLYRGVEVRDDTTISRFLNTVYSYRAKHGDDDIDYDDGDRDREQIEGLMKDAENWEILSENADGFLFLRDRSMPRLVMDQLIALQPEGAHKGEQGPFLIGRISSLRQEYDGSTARLSVRHKIGLKLLPGLPKPVGVQIEGMPTTDAYWLGAQPALHLPESLVIPLAAFREGREIFMISAGQRRRVKLEALLYRGLDFDQVIYTVVK